MRRRSAPSHGAFEVGSLIRGARVRRKFLLSCARHAARHLRGRVGLMVFVLADDREMIRLNRCYLGKNRTTDVLAFDLSDAPGVVDGEVYIGLEQARRQARDHRVPLYVEVARLAIHGVLHLAGYDDHRDHDRQLMHRLEEQSLKAMRPRR